MKKILGVSIAAMLAVTPMLAGATGATPDAANTSSEPFAGVTATANSNIATTSFVQGAYNAAIGAVNTRLMNDASTPEIIDRTVQTTLRPAEDDNPANEASDTALVTEKAVRTAIDAVSTAAGNNLEAAAGTGLVWDDTNNEFDLSLGANDGLVITAGTNGAPDTLGVKLDGTTLVSGANGLSVNTAKGLTQNGSGAIIPEVDNSTIEIDSTNGLQVKDGGVTAAKLASGLVQGSVRSTVDSNAQGYAAWNGNQTVASEKAVAEAIGTATTGMATETGVEETIAATTITVTVYDTWNSGNTQTVTAAVTKPTYTEGASNNNNNQEEEEEEEQGGSGTEEP